MPIYEYKCQKCKKEFEVFQRISDPEITHCQFCGGPVSKLVSLSSFHLKGSGWYVTDYGGKKPASTGAESQGEKEKEGKEKEDKA
ncbi:MAG TPA: zinc ribbon domain-containing protein [Syntrophales bacterium]|nr:zinc ribbon domain-containing protein [Syntrophales bacterium]HOL58298.1 zinc ribbon domain-containing protein [Syntrophales bacterium]HPO34467.1 zinc ribbon domain-containing protein [Syntrophales bacterium]